MTKDKTTEDIFLPVTQEETRTSILDSLIRTNETVYLRGADRELRSSMCYSYSSDSIILDMFEEMIPNTGEAYTIHFTNGGDKYFARTRLSSVLEEMRFGFKFSSRLHRLQRRGNFRIAIPSDLDFELKFEDIPGVGERIYPIKDLSAGGCRIFVPTDMSLYLQNGRSFAAKLLLKAEGRFDVQFEIRHASKPGPKATHFEAGGQFHFSSQQQEHKLLSLTFDLYRRLYFSN